MRELRGVMKSFALGLASAFLLVCETHIHAGLTFESALEQTLSCSPELQAFRADVQVMVGEQVQADLYENPIFGYSVENVFGNKHWKGWESAESRYEIAQPIPLGGQKELQRNAALFRTYAMQSEYAGEVLKVGHALKEKFLEIAFAQEGVKLAENQYEIAKKLEEAALARVEAGKASPIERNRALISKLNSENVLQKSKIELDKARYELALMWGANRPDFERVDFLFTDLEAPPSLEQCLACVENHPLVLKAQFDHWAAYKEYEREKALRVPDAVVTVGYKTLRDTGEKGMILGASFPLPIFDRKQGLIHRGSAETIHLAYHLYEIRVRLESKLISLHKEALYAFKQATDLRNTLVSLARETFESVQEGFMNGKTDYLMLLEAQQTFFEIQEKDLEASLEYLKKLADIEWFYE